MMNTKVLIEELKSQGFQERLQDIYVDDGVITYQTERYQRAIEKFEELYGEQEAEIYSAPGRSEDDWNQQPQPAGLFRGHRQQHKASEIDSTGCTVRFRKRCWKRG